jgi:PAS domain S-box-containing protein
MKRPFGDVGWIELDSTDGNTHSFRAAAWGVALSAGDGMAFLEVSEEFARMHGYAPHELRGQPIRSVIPEEERGKQPDAVIRSDRDGHFVYERLALRKDGTRFPAQVALSSIRDTEGNIVLRAAHVLDIRLRKETEAALRFASFATQHNADGIFWVRSSDSIITYANPAACGMTGYDAADLIGSTFANVDPGVLDTLEAARNGVKAMERKHRRKDGSVFPVELTLNQLEFDGRGFLCLMVRDITVRKNEERAMRFAQFGLDTASDDTFWIDENGRVVYVNDSACRSLGYTREELLTLGITDFVPRYSADSWGATIARLREAKKASFESVHKRKDGSLFPTEINAYYTEYEGKPYICGYARDVTQMKQLVEELRQQRTRLELLNGIARGARSDGSVDSIITHTLSELARGFPSYRVSYAVADDDGNVRVLRSLAPEGMLDTSGHAADLRVVPEFLGALRTGRRNAIAYPDVQADPRLEAFRESLRAAGIGAILIAAITQDERVFGLLDLHAPTPHEWSEHECRTLDEVADYLGMVLKEARLLEERERAELQVRNLNANLEAQVEKRTQELSTANAELEAFVYSVSHDLRAPVRAMSSFSEIVLEDAGPLVSQRNRTDLARISQAARRMEGMIDDLLSLSRVSLRRLRSEPVDLSALTRTLLDELIEAEPKRRVETCVRADLLAQGDPGTIRILLQNLLTNAWKFTRDTQPAQIEIGVDETDPRAAFFVRDNGAGFDMRYANKLFTPFQRLHSVEEFEGTGIGLATVDRIVRRHGGEVWAYGEVGKGATVYFTLPAPKPPPADIET